MNPDAFPAFTKFIFQSDSKVNLKRDNFTHKIQGMTDDFKIQIDDEVIYKTVFFFNCFQNGFRYPIRYRNPNGVQQKQYNNFKNSLLF